MVNVAQDFIKKAVRKAFESPSLMAMESRHLIYGNQAIPPFFQKLIIHHQTPSGKVLCDVPQLGFFDSALKVPPANYLKVYDNSLRSICDLTVNGLRPGFWVSGKTMFLSISKHV